MILGVGNDLVDIKRIEDALARFGERFEQRVFTAREQQKAHSRTQTAATYAKRFAAKEACAKALGTGLQDGVFWRDMEVVNLPNGAPTIQLSGGARKKLEALLPPGMVAHIFVTLTDEYPLAQAQVIIVAEPQ